MGERTAKHISFDTYSSEGDSDDDGREVEVRMIS